MIGSLTLLSQGRRVTDRGVVPCRRISAKMLGHCSQAEPPVMDAHQ